MTHLIDNNSDASLIKWKILQETNILHHLAINKIHKIRFPHFIFKK